MKLGYSVGFLKMIISPQHPVPFLLGYSDNPQYGHHEEVKI